MGAFQAGPVECLTVAGQIAMRPGTIRHFVYMPFPAFKETLAPHIAALREKGAVFVFESSWQKPYSTRGVRAMLARCAGKAGLDHNMPPHRLRHFLSPGSRPTVSTTLSSSPTAATPAEPRWIYSKIALGSAQDACKSVIDQFPV
jgi:integrase/recombinase XerD